MTSHNDIGNALSDLQVGLITWEKAMGVVNENPQTQTSKEAKAICRRNCEVTHSTDTALRMAICKAGCSMWNSN